MKPLLVTSYVGPDLDGAACVVAYAEFLSKNGKDAVAGFLGEPQQEVVWVFERYGFSLPEILPDAHDFEEIVLCDTSRPRDLDEKIPLSRIIEVIDHHVYSKEPDAFPNARMQVEKVGAAATLIFERYTQANIEPSKQSATLLALAIASNTVNFKGVVVTGRDREAFRILKEKAGFRDEAVREMFLGKSDLRGSRLAEVIQSDYEVHIFGGKHLCIAQIEMIDARSLVAERTKEIVDELHKLKMSETCDLEFLTILDVESDENIFVTDNPEAQKLLTTLFKVQFEDSIARYPELLMRKEMTPLLKDELVKQESVKA